MPKILAAGNPGVSSLTPAQYGDLIVRPVERQSVALTVSNVVKTGSHDFHVPILSQDATAVWVAEGADLTGDPTEFDEITVTPSKVGRVVAISNELADDSNPSAAIQVGNSLARAIATEVDHAYFGDLAAPAPKGLASLTGISQVAAGAAWSNTDPFAEAIAVSESYGGNIGFFVAHPDDYLAMMKIKKQAGSNEPLLGADASAPTKRTILGVPLLSSPAVTSGAVWGIVPDFSTAVLRTDVTVEASREFYFGQDLTAVKGTMRVGFAFPHQKAIVKITKGA